MPKQALFARLIFDENDKPVEFTYIGEEPCYVVDDAGFRRHIAASEVDRQVLQWMQKAVEGHEDLLADQTAKMLGQEDIFTRAMIQNQFKNLDQQFDKILETGIPEEGRAYMGMMGFRVIINHHGEVLEVIQPGMAAPDGGES